MLFFHKKKTVSQEILAIVILLLFISIMFSVSAYFQFHNLFLLETTMYRVQEQVRDLQNNLIDRQDVEKVQKSVLGITSNFPVWNLTTKDLQGIFTNPEFTLSKIPVITQKFSPIGSCVLIDASHGILATSYHVINNVAAQYKVTNKHGKESSFVIISFNEEKDIALIQVQNFAVLEGMTAIPLSSKAPLGSDMIMGYGFSLKSPNVFVGNIQNTNAVFEALPQAQIIQTNFHINSGDSGGALVNAKGELAGILIAFSQGSQESLAIPSIEIAKLLIKK